MISCFTTIYPDELLYSLLARYYIKSGYAAYIFAAEDLYTSRTVRPNIEFINKFNSDALQMITGAMPMKTIVEKHTMFPYYGRFLSKERRNKAFDSLVSMQSDYHNLLAIPKSKSAARRYLRYCPLCSRDDRKKYGETYWHRIHQMLGVNVCPVHRCKLINSSLIISGKASPTLIAAEPIIPSVDDIVYSDNDAERKVAQYIASVFTAAVDMQSEVAAGDFLHSRLANSKYLSTRGQQRNIGLLHSDFTEYYKTLSNNCFTELWQLQKVFTNDRFNTYEICLIAMFLNITVNDLVNMKLPGKKQEELFDEQVFKLREKGLKYPQIAKRLNASYDMVKSIREKRYGNHHKSSNKALKGMAKRKNWSKIDTETLPLVRQAIVELWGDGITRPKKVSIFAVGKLLNLTNKQIDNLPQCKAEIKKYYELQEEYWAREVAWAVNKILREGEPFNWKHIKELTNMRKKNLAACIPFLDKFVNYNMIEQIKEMV